MDPLSFNAPEHPGGWDAVSDFQLQLVGFLPVHPMTTIPMLPWIVAEIRRLAQGSPKELLDTTQIRLYVSKTQFRCELDIGVSREWDPLICSSLFEHRPQCIRKMIHNSQDPSYFACLIKEDEMGKQQHICYVFRAADETKVPEIITSIRQAGKIARQEECQARLSDVDDAFAKKFEVLFCGRVTVANKKAPPALIDECIEKFNHASNTQKSEVDLATLEQENLSNLGFLKSSTFRSMFQSPFSDDEDNKSFRKCSSQPGLRTWASKKAWQDSSSSSSLPGSFDEQEVPLDIPTEVLPGCSLVQPMDIEGNRTMLFTGIRHVDHFGFICREPLENGGCHFVCYVFQCTNEQLVDEIMLTLKQAFSVAAAHQHSKVQDQICEGCPMQGLHKLCEKIEGLHPSKTRLELQKHLSLLNNQEQASVFEEVQKIRPRSDHKENEMIISILRCLYEEKQKRHVHSWETKQMTAHPAQELPSLAPRFRFDMLTSKAKRSLAESLENILSRGSKARIQRETSGSLEFDSTLTGALTSASSGRFLNETEAEVLSNSIPLKPHGSVGDLSQDTKSQCSSDSVELSQPAFRRRANTLSHFPMERTSSLETVERAPSVSQRKLTRYHSLSTESPEKQNLGISASEPPCCSDLPAAPNCLAPSASSPSLLKKRKSSPCGEQGGPPLQKSFSYRTVLRNKLRSSSSVPNFLKFLVPVAENTPSDCNTTTSEYEWKPVDADISSDTPVKTRRHSWRQQIFLRVATPQKACDSPNRYDGDRSDLGDLAPRSPLEPVFEDGPFGPAMTRSRTSEELRDLWQKAILQQILLLRMEKENRKLQASENDLLNKRLKLDYEEITLCLKDVTLVWEKMLGMPGRSKTKFDMEKIHNAVAKGVPRHHRGEIWKLLSEQYQLRHPLPSKQQLKDTPYKELLKQLTSQQHAILIDLGRTFPTHPYFSAQLGAGQLSLYNILKAYSLLDPEVGYCQGLSFVAGILLLHMSEEDAFNMLKFLMFDMGLRKQYRPDMIILQIQMYQLSRLLHDYHRDLYNHLEEYEIGPSLYAAPWFLTMFASQFPLGFVARVFDIIFLEGSEVIFKVSLSLLGSHKPLILQHENLEPIVEFIKNTLPNLGLVQMEKTINQVFEMDISKQLQAYEVEYYVLQDELIDSSPLSENQRMDKLEKTNSSLRKQNLDLLEHLQVAHGKIQSLESTVENAQSSESKLKHSLLALELERSALLNTVEELRAQIQALSLQGTNKRKATN
ncbi:TBC1 domain family member 1 isoform X2 [Ambystoma mexicanum]|uniref:TBC1 domain family member 1 isoform X2 n=1 Tax=Ambystoma mexicanum TaxID=8296 RepID=UPI0037E752DA